MVDGLPRSSNLPEVVVYADTETEARAKAVDDALEVFTNRIRQAGGA